MIYRALIPVKTLHQAKSRLAPYLKEEERAALVFEMLHHVVLVLQASLEFDQISVVSPDLHVLEQAQQWGCEALIEEQQGHNPALEAAASKALAAGIDMLLTISVDLPLLQISDICNIMEQARQSDVVLAPSLDGTGTNALLVRPPLALPYLFGPGSLQRYVAEAKQRHLSLTFVKSVGLALDIDTINDLEMYQRHKGESEAAHVAHVTYFS